MQRLEVSGVVDPYIWVVRRQTVKRKSSNSKVTVDRNRANILSMVCGRNSDSVKNEQ